MSNNNNNISHRNTSLLLQTSLIDLRDSFNNLFDSCIEDVERKWKHLEWKKMILSRIRNCISDNDEPLLVCKDKSLLHEIESILHFKFYSHYFKIVTGILKSQLQLAKERGEYQKFGALLNSIFLQSHCVVCIVKWLLNKYYIKFHKEDIDFLENSRKEAERSMIYSLKINHTSLEFLRREKNRNGNENGYSDNYDDENKERNIIIFNTNDNMKADYSLDGEILNNEKKFKEYLEEHVFKHDIYYNNNNDDGDEKFHSRQRQRHRQQKKNDEDTSSLMREKSFLEDVNKEVEEEEENTIFLNTRNPFLSAVVDSSTAFQEPLLFKIFIGNANENENKKLEAELLSTPSLVNNENVFRSSYHVAYIWRDKKFDFESIKSSLRGRVKDSEENFAALKDSEEMIKSFYSSVRSFNKYERELKSLLKNMNQSENSLTEAIHKYRVLVYSNRKCLKKFSFFSNCLSHLSFNNINNNNNDDNNDNNNSNNNNNNNNVNR
uniref:Uncharacterized protein n=1 Tax=Armadillidium vulgare clopovirus TaxID=2984284 RepID=A0A9C7F7D3_9VIRU|nr:MAG: hypothetical protein [Armadillidium vulgare clopovirus]